MKDSKAEPWTFRMRETMRGVHRFESGGSASAALPFDFTLDWGPAPEWGTFRRGLVMDAVGELRAEGLCERADCRGQLVLDYWGAAELRYDLSFEQDGQRYRYLGRKVNIRPWNLPMSHTTCTGLILDADARLVSTTLSHFRFRDLASFVGSFRVLRSASLAA
ncbi:MAG: hypothetical protein RBU37_14540 [Myxococcota bacterium]|jgi:hypothetical protein|nr:hypothetical protein [Myxococcota bacterium]